MKTKRQIGEEFNEYLQEKIVIIADRDIEMFMDFLHKIREQDREHYLEKRLDFNVAINHELLKNQREQIKKEIKDCIPLKTTGKNIEYCEGVEDTIDGMIAGLKEKDLI
jgi:hypothetical protein